MDLRNFDLVRKFRLLFCLLALFTGFAARADLPEVLSSYLTVGLGWRVCPDSDNPPSLDKAFECDGMEPDLVRTEIKLKKHEGTNGFPYWMGDFEDTVSLRGNQLKVRLLITFGTSGGTPENPGKKVYFIEGELISGKPRNRVLFQIAAEDGFARLPTTLYWGQAILMKKPYEGLNLLPVFYLGGAEQ